jgi:hypothetical protein
MGTAWIRPEAVLSGVQGTRARLRASATQALRDLDTVRMQALEASVQREREILEATLMFLALPAVKQRSEADREWDRMAKERGEFTAPPVAPPPPIASRPAALGEPAPEPRPRIRRHPRPPKEGS